MSRGQLLLAVGVCLLLGAVIGGMCVGLPDESRRSRSRVAESESESAEEITQGDDPQTDEGASADYEDEDEDEPVLDGVRSLTGVVESKDGELLAGAEVEIEGADRLRTSSDDQGEYQLDRVPLGELTLVVRVLGYAEAREAIDRGRQPDGVERHDVTLADGDEVAGKVVDPEGKPVTSAKVYCAETTDDELSTESDRYGRFALPEQAAGCKGVARYQGFGDATPVTLEVGARNLLALKRPASVSGVVVDSSGEPVRAFALTIDNYRAAGSESAQGRRYRQSYSHPKGRFTVRGLAAGSYELTVRRRGGSEAPAKKIELEAGQQLEGLRIVAR